MRLKNVAAGYQNHTVVSDLTLDVQKGEIVSLIGPNGSGKSTILKTVTKNLKPLGGAVYLNARDIGGMSAKELATQMSVVTTERIRVQYMTCRDVVLAGRLPFTNGFGVLKEEDRAICEDAIALMEIADFADHPYENVSDGQKQRTLIARAICQSPSYLIMDEPTSYMDVRHRLELMGVLKKLSEKGVTIVMSLHEAELALSVSDRVVLVYEDGKTRCEKPDTVIENGLLKELYGLTDEMYAQAFSHLVKQEKET